MLIKRVSLRVCGRYLHDNPWQVAPVQAVNKKGHIEIKWFTGKLVLSLGTAQPNGLLVIQPAVV